MLARTETEQVIPDDYLTWHHVEVEGRRAVYGVGGSGGAPVLFLHGWAMGSRAYRRAMRRLIRRGCWVFAPALPAFGGTAALPPDERTIEGYANWVASFVNEVDITGPLLVIGHSFGGGVGIKLSQLHPEMVRCLVLLNAVGTAGPRPPWEWVLALGREVWPVRNSVEMLRAMRADLVPNLVENPLEVLRVGRLLQQTDLRPELCSLEERGLPVVVLTSEDDTVIPHEAFMALCEAVGTPGRVVRGNHSWLLASPDSFEEVLASVINIELAAHESSTATEKLDDTVDLLRKARFPARRARSLLGSAPPLWLLSQSAPDLAADLALSRPRLRTSEVRALAVPVEGTDAVRLTVAATDRRGLLADSATVLASQGLSITSSWAATWPNHRLALHTFLVERGTQLDEEGRRRLGESLQVMGKVCSDPVAFAGPFRAVRVATQGSPERCIVKVTARNDLGLLATVCRCLQEQGVNIEWLHARTEGPVIHDTFVVVGKVDSAGLAAALECRGLASG